MKKIFTIFSRLAGKMFFSIFLMLIMAGCATLKPTPYELRERESLGDIKMDFYGMTDEDIKTYFNYCINNEKIFIYTGGFANVPLVDKEDYDFAWQFKSVSVGCEGGVEEAGKFNKLMLEYIKQNLSLAKKLSNPFAGMSKEDLKRRGYEKYIQKSNSPETNEEIITFNGWQKRGSTITFYLKDDKVQRWEKSDK